MKIKTEITEFNLIKMQNRDRVATRNKAEPRRSDLNIRVTKPPAAAPGAAARLTGLRLSAGPGVGGLSGRAVARHRDSLTGRRVPGAGHHGKTVTRCIPGSDIIL